MNIDSSKIIEINIDDILPNRFQPRIQFDEDEILELSDSIKKHGIIQPIVVRPIGDKYEIIAGERRYKAGVLAGLEYMPTIVKELDDKQSAEIALIENLQRKSLTPIEEALSYKKVLDLGNLTQEGLAEKIGKSQSSVANKIRLLSLSDEVQEALLDNKISERHARSLLKLKSIGLQNEMLNRIIKERMTVRKTDEEIEKIINNNMTETIIEEKEVENKMNNESLQVDGFNQLNDDNSINSNQFLSSEISNLANTFDIFADDTLNTPASPEMPTVPSFNMEAPATVAPEMPTVPSFNMEAPATVAPEMPTVPSFNMEAPTTIAPEMPTVPSFNMEAPTTIAPEMPTIPSSDAQQEAQIPDTKPIIENQVDGIPNDSLPEQSVQPIIITDYTKQFDPVMPYQAPQSLKIDFKEVINLIRECSSKIEQYGFKIDVEEYDLANLYQVVFKIDK